MLDDTNRGVLVMLRSWFIDCTWHASYFVDMKTAHIPGLLMPMRGLSSQSSRTWRSQVLQTPNEPCTSTWKRQSRDGHLDILGFKLYCSSHFSCGLKPKVQVLLLLLLLLPLLFKCPGSFRFRTFVLCCGCQIGLDFRASSNRGQFLRSMLSPWHCAKKARATDTADSAHKAKWNVIIWL